MKDFTAYANFAKGTFYISATLLMVVSAYIVYTEWQDYWAGGFKDFRSISAAIVELEKTARPVSDIAPQMFMQMEQMNHSVGKMQESVHRMDIAVNGINTAVYAMSYTVPYRMDTLRNKMSPWRMMNPFEQR